MSKKRLSLILIFVLLVSLVGVVPAAAAPPDPPDVPDEPQAFLRDDDIIDIGPILRAQDYPLLGVPDISEDELTRSNEIRATQAYTVGDQLIWLALDTYYGGYYWTTYTVYTITEHSEIWVQDDLNYYNADGTLNTIHPDADDPDYVTPENLDYLSETFDEVIYPTNTEFFGMHDNHDGTYGFEGYFGIQELDADDGQRVVILISNIGDLNFYNPVLSGSFIIGFYSSTYEFYSDRNMITIDSKQWDQRVGNPNYDYSNTLAHEFQHLIHDDYSSGEDAWINEGMSGFSEFLNGFWVSDQLGGRTSWQNWPENSVVLWGDQDFDQPGGVETLADYQLSNAFMLYTTGRIGGVYTDTAKLTSQSEDGILGFNAWLSDIAGSNPDAVGLTFNDIFEDFRVDMLYGGFTDEATPIANWNADFIGDYPSPLTAQQGAASPVPADLSVLRDNLDNEGYDWPGVPPFGTDFIEVCWSEAIGTAANWEVAFDGDESAIPTNWAPITASTIYTPSGNVTGDVLYSGHDTLSDNFVIFDSIPTISAGDILTFEHYYNIEGDWDYGFVQVTTDTTGMTGWTSLDITGTVTGTVGGTHPIIAENVPGFSGFSGGWVESTYDLSAYAGEDVLLAFRYSTDWGTAGNVGGYPAGWAIDNVQVGSTLLTDGSTNGKSIQEVRGMGNKFAFEFAVLAADGSTNLYTATLDADMMGTLDLATIGDTDFDSAGERGVLMVSQMMDVYDDLVAGGLAASYADYTLENVPPSLCTSNMDAYGNTHISPNWVYAGEAITVATTMDNIGASANISTTGPITFYVGLETPADTTYALGSVTNGAILTDDLSTVSAAFPAVEGVYWMGLVTDTDVFAASFNTDPTLLVNTPLTATVHFASDDTTMPDQYFHLEDNVTVASPFDLSGLLAVEDPVYRDAWFAAKVLNMSHGPKQVIIVADHPANTTFVDVVGATVVTSDTNQITVTQTIDPYAEVGMVGITFTWQLDLDVYQPGDMVDSVMTMIDTVTDDAYDLSASAEVEARLFLPVIFKEF